MSKSSFLRICTLFLFFLIAIGSVGCSHHIPAQVYPMKPGMVPEFSGGRPITIINAQDKTEAVLIGAQMGHKYFADLNQFTETATELLKTELAKRDIEIAEGAEKQLKLSVTRVQLYWGFAAIRCILNVKVETLDGYIREFEGNNASPWTLYRACNGAITKAVGAMLNDDSILAYLKH